MHVQTECFVLRFLPEARLTKFFSTFTSTKQINNKLVIFEH